MNAQGTSRVLEKLHASLDRKEYYEAHQMYRTLYFRYLSQKKHPELLELLFDGALKFLEHGQVSSGADLALLFADSLQQAKPAVSENILLKLEQLLSKLPTGASKNCKHNRAGACGHHRGSSPSPGSSASAKSLTDSANAVSAEVRIRFMDASMKWSNSLPESKMYRNGHPKLHQKFASVFWSEKNYLQARDHFMLSEDGEGCAMFLIEFQTHCGYPNEIDLFLAQAVLQFLCRQNQQTANVCFFQYTLKHPDIPENGPPFVRPMLNFLWLLLLSIDVGKVQYFSILVEMYQPSIQRDPCYMQYLDKIGQVFFGLPPPKPKPTAAGGGGMFMDLVKDLFTADDSDEQMTDALEEEDDEEFQSIPGSPIAGMKNPSHLPNGSVPQASTSNKKMAEADLD